MSCYIAVTLQRTRLTSSKVETREIVAHLVSQMPHEIEGDPPDLMLAAIERSLVGSPFQQLASCLEINTASEFLEGASIGYALEPGRYESPNEQASCANS